MSSASKQATTGGQQAAPSVQIQFEGDQRNEREIERLFRQIGDQTRDIGEARGYDVTTSVINTSNVRDLDSRRERTVRLTVDYTFVEEREGSRNGGNSDRSDRSGQNQQGSSQSS